MFEYLGSDDSYMDICSEESSDNRTDSYVAVVRVDPGVDPQEQGKEFDTQSEMSQTRNAKDGRQQLINSDNSSDDHHILTQVCKEYVDPIPESSHSIAEKHDHKSKINLARDIHSGSSREEHTLLLSKKVSQQAADVHKGGPAKGSSISEGLTHAKQRKEFMERHFKGSGHHAGQMTFTSSGKHSWFVKVC